MKVAADQRVTITGSSRRGNTLHIGKQVNVYSVETRAGTDEVETLVLEIPGNGEMEYHIYSVNSVKVR